MVYWVPLEIWLVTGFFSNAMDFDVKMLIILVFFLLPVTSPANDLGHFADRFVTHLNSSSFDLSIFCSKYWLLDQQNTCYKGIPWEHLRSLQPSFAKSKETSKPDSAFVILKLSKGSLLLTATYEQNEWRMSLDLKKVWEAYTCDWKSSKRQIEIRYAEPISHEASDDLERRIVSFQKQITQSLNLPLKADIPFYFLNSQKEVSDLGIEFPKFISGGARDGFVLIIGDPTVGMWSTFLHELVHIYTAFHGSFWKGQGIFSNAAFSEGLATLFQMEKVWDDNLPSKLVGQYLCKDIQATEQLSESDLFQILDNTFFRNFDTQGYHPAYLVGAAIVKIFFESMTTDEFVTLWNEIGRASNFEEIKLIVSNKKSSKELFFELNRYVKGLRKQISEKTQSVCP